MSTSIKWLLWGVGAIILVGYIGLRLYISSASFTTHIAELTSDVLGTPIEFKEKVRIESIFPRLSVTLPSTHFDTQQEGFQTRGRITGMNISMSLIPILLHDNTRDLKIHINDVSATSDGDVDSDTDQNNPIETLTSVTKLFQVMLNNTFDLQIKSLTFISRNSSGNHVEQLDNTNLISSPEGITLASTVVNNDAALQFSLSVKPQENEDSEIETKQLSITLILDAGNNTYSELHTNIIVFGNDRFTLPDIVLTQGKNIIEGAIELSRLNDPDLTTLVTGTIDVKRLDLALWNNPFNDISNRLTSKNKAAPLFEDSPINYKQITNIESDINVQIGALRFNGQPLVNGKFTLKNDASTFSVMSHNATSMGAPFELSYSGKKLQNNPYFSLHATLTNIDISRIGNILSEAALFDKGYGSSELTLAYHGVTPREHVETLGGALVIKIADAHLTASFSQWLDKGIMAHIKGLAKKNDEIRTSSGREIPCFNAFIGIQNGYAIADESILIETPDNLLISSGVTDFHSETIRYVFKSNTKKMIDWSPLGMVKYMRIGGSLSEPKLTVNEAELTKKGALTLVSLFAGPIPGLALSAVNAAKNRKKQKPMCHI